jgi:hypothetical protein
MEEGEIILFCPLFVKELLKPNISIRKASLMHGLLKKIFPFLALGQSCNDYQVINKAKKPTREIRCISQSED